MAKITVGVDAGSRGARFLALRKKGTGLSVQAFAFLPLGEDARVPPSFRGREWVLGLGGRDLRLHYAQVPPVPDWQLRNLVEFEVKEIASQSGQELCADFNLLPGSSELTGEDMVLIALAREENAEERRKWTEERGGKLAALTPTPIALYNALLVSGETREGETLLAAHLGRETMDVVLTRGPDLLFARNLSGGGKVFDEAVAQAFNLTLERAEKVKIEYANLDPSARERYASSQEEKVSRALLGASGQLASALRSTVAFCQTQTGLRDLKVDRILLSGGTASMRGITRLLNEHFRCPVDLMDPFAGGAVDLSSLTREEARELMEEGPRAVLALGLAAGRASGDLYEVEILPTRLRKKREFLAGPLFSWIAGAAAFLFLVLFFQASAARYEKFSSVKKKLLYRLNQANRIDRDASAILEKNRASLAEIRLLEDLGGRGPSLLRAWRAFAKTMPPELWARSVQVDKGGPSRVVRSKEEVHPLVVLKGLGKQQDLAINDVYNQFLAFLEEALGGIRPRSQIGTGVDPVDRSRILAFTVILDFFAGPARKRSPQGKGGN